MALKQRCANIFKWQLPLRVRSEQRPVPAVNVKNIEQEYSSKAGNGLPSLPVIRRLEARCIVPEQHLAPRVSARSCSRCIPRGARRDIRSAMHDRVSAAHQPQPAIKLVSKALDVIAAIGDNNIIFCRHLRVE